MSAYRLIWRQKIGVYCTVDVARSRMRHRQKVFHASSHCPCKFCRIRETSPTAVTSKRHVLMYVSALGIYKRGHCVRRGAGGWAGLFLGPWLHSNAVPGRAQFDALFFQLLVHAIALYAASILASRYQQGMGATDDSIRTFCSSVFWPSPCA